MRNFFEGLFKPKPVSPKDYIANKIRKDLDNKIKEYLHDPTLDSVGLGLMVYGAIATTMQCHRENTEMQQLSGLSRAEYDKLLDELTTEITNKYLRH